MMAALLVLFLSVAVAFKAPLGVNRIAKYNAIPLELEGKLDESKSWPVKFLFNGEEKVLFQLKSYAIVPNTHVGGASS